MLTSSADGTARMWCSFKSEPLLSFTSASGGGSGRAAAALNASATASAAALARRRRRSGGGSSSPSLSLARTAGSVPFGDAVAGVSFYYMDKFILLASGSSLYAYTFSIDEHICDANDDLARQNTNSTYTLAKQWDFAPANRVSGFAAINSFLSHLVVVALSDNTIGVVDVAADKIVRIQNAGPRAPASVHLASSCAYASHPKESFNVFMTSSNHHGGTLSLWDLRTQSVVATFSSHKNVSKACGAALSPCLRYVATGSEDGACYIYDVRRGGAELRLTGQHRGAVTDVAFNPLHPQLATAGADGSMHFYAAV